jgi:acetate kinase
MPREDTILVANIGSTSFKFRLYEMPSERLLARGGMDRIGGSVSNWSLQIGDGGKESGEGNFPDYRSAVDFVRDLLVGRGVLESFGQLRAFGFKPVMAREVSGTQVMDERVLGAMEAFSAVFPAHNPPYIQAVRQFREAYPEIPCIGMFETAFYDQVPEHNRRFGIPLKWEREYGVRRYGFHGASHRFVSSRLGEITGRTDLRLISCHLGGSSSLACVQNGVAIDSSWGMTAQSGLPHNNRVGDFDAFALLYVMEQFGVTAEEAGRELSKNGGLQGMSGLASGDIRDLLQAAGEGNADAASALQMFVGSIRKYIGQFLVELNGADALIFTAGIGENNPSLRSEVCSNLDFCGLQLDEARNAANGGAEGKISTDDSKIEVWVIPTNEEIVIARSTWNLLQQQN